MANPLTPAVRLQTRAPFPIFRKNIESGKTELSVDATTPIVIESSAELLDYSIPGSKYGTSGDLLFLHDAEGQPLVISIGTDKVCKPRSRKNETDKAFSVSISARTSMVVPEAGKHSISPQDLDLNLCFVTRARALITGTFLLQSAAVMNRRRLASSRSSLIARDCHPMEREILLDHHSSVSLPEQWEAMS